MVSELIKHFKKLLYYLRPATRSQIFPFVATDNTNVNRACPARASRKLAFFEYKSTTASPPAFRIIMTNDQELERYSARLQADGDWVSIPYYDWQGDIWFKWEALDATGNTKVMLTVTSSSEGDDL